jgi:hypothetical protein
MGIDMIDTYNWFNLDQYAKDKRYGHFTASPKIKGTVFNPQFDWSATASQLAKNAAQGVGKEILKEKVGEQLKGKIPGKAGDAVNKLLGGGGGSGSSPAPAAPAAPNKEDVKKGLKKLFGR